MPYGIPRECDRVNVPFSIDIPPFWGVERQKTFLASTKSVRGNLGYYKEQDLRKMTKFHLFSQDSVRLETAPTGGVRKS